MKQQIIMKETAPTLCADAEKTKCVPIIVLESHPNDSRVRIVQDGVFQSLTSRMGTGGVMCH